MDPGSLFHQLNVISPSIFAGSSILLQPYYRLEQLLGDSKGFKQEKTDGKSPFCGMNCTCDSLDRPVLRTPLHLHSPKVKLQINNAFQLLLKCYKLSVVDHHAESSERKRQENKHLCQRYLRQESFVINMEMNAH